MKNRLFKGVRWALVIILSVISVFISGFLALTIIWKSPVSAAQSLAFHCVSLFAVVFISMMLIQLLAPSLKATVLRTVAVFHVLVILGLSILDTNRSDYWSGITVSGVASIIVISSVSVLVFDQVRQWLFSKPLLFPPMMESVSKPQKKLFWLCHGWRWLILFLTPFVGWMIDTGIENSVSKLFQQVFSIPEIVPQYNEQSGLIEYNSSDRYKSIIQYGAQMTWSLMISVLVTLSMICCLVPMRVTHRFIIAAGVLIVIGNYLIDLYIFVPPLLRQYLIFSCLAVLTAGWVINGWVEYFHSLRKAAIR